MRPALYAALLVVSLVRTAQAAELQVLTPPLIYAGLSKLATAYTRQTGITVTVKSDVMGKIVGDIKTGVPAADVIALPTDLMDVLDKDGGIKAGSKTSLGRVEIALAVRAGAPHPNITTVEKLRAALQSAKAVIYSQPGPPRNSMEASIIDSLLKRPEFAQVHASMVPMANGSGVAALARGEGDMAMQVIPEILSVKEIELVGPLPPELGAHIDTATAISARSADAEDALAFIRYITSAEATSIWKAEGVSRF